MLRGANLGDDNERERVEYVFPPFLLSRAGACTSSSSCSWSSLAEVRSDSSERRAMIVSRVDAAIGNAVRIDASAREG